LQSLSEPHSHCWQSDSGWTDAGGMDTSIFRVDTQTVPTMKCERCGDDTRVLRHDVDGFTGYLCEACESKWGRM